MRTETKITIREVGDWNALYRHYGRQSRQQDCYVELDCRRGILRAAYNSEIGNAIPFSVYHGHDRRYPIPCLTADAANELLAEIAPLAQRVVDGYESDWDGNNHVAVLTPDAEAADHEIDALIESNHYEQDEAAHVNGIEAGDWIVDCPDGLTAATTDEELAAMAADLETEAAVERIVLEGALRRLEEFRRGLAALAGQ